MRLTWVAYLWGWIDVQLHNEVFRKKSDSPPSYCCLRLELVRGEEFWREKLGSSSNRLIRLSSSKVKEYISG